MFVIVLFAIVSFCQAGVIPHEGSYSHGPQATSYQHVKIENYHSVPVYVKKEHSHLLEHPVSRGQTATNLQVQHGGEHDHGYAVASGTHQQLLGHGAQGEQELGGYEHQLQGQLGGQEQIVGHQQLGGHGELGGQEQLGGHEQLGGQEQIGGHQQVVFQQEEQHEGGADLGHYDSGADLSGQGLQAYATHGADYGHGGQEAQGVDYGHAGQESAGYEQEAAGYEQAVDDSHQHYQ